MMDLECELGSCCLESPCLFCCTTLPQKLSAFSNFAWLMNSRDELELKHTFLVL